MRNVGFLVLIAALLAPCSTNNSIVGPNLVLISMDTLRADHLGSYGYYRDTSPRIDRFADESILFEHAYSTSAWTFPSHYSMFTGRYPDRNELVTYPTVKRFQDGPVLAEILRSHDWETVAFTGGGFVGKLGFERGFDRYVSRGKRFEDNQEELLEWLRGKDSTSQFFLFAHGYNTHRPYDPPKSVAGSFVKEIPGPCEGLTFANDQDLEINDCILAAGGLHYLFSRYDEEILFADQLLGQILDTLRERKLLDNSIVIVTSDHGEELKDHGSLDHTKTLYQELIHVPLMVRIPGEAPKRIKEKVSIAQIMPTALELLGVPYTEESLHAVSLFPVGGSEPADVFSVTAFSHRFPFRELMYSIVRDRYKLITYENPSISSL